MTHAEPLSWYAATATPSPSYPALDKDISVDVCIVGAGMTGCTAALHLAERGYKVAVIEGETVGYGASGRSGGQIIAGYNRDQREIAAIVGKDDARKLWDLDEEAHHLTRDVIERHAIACDYTRGHVTAGFKPRHDRELKAICDDWRALGRQGVEFWDKAEVQRRIASPKYSSGVHDPDAAHLHPLNYTLGLARAAHVAGATLYEHTPLLSWEQGDPATIRTPKGTIKAKFLLLCGNAYLWERERRLGKTIMPVGTYIGASEPLGEDRARALIPGNQAVADCSFVLDYYRLSSDHRMLFGGKVSYSRMDPPNLAETMRKRMVSVFPQLDGVRMDYAWGGYVAITINRLPQFGRLAPNVLFAHGYSGHGVALTAIAGKLLAETVAGQSGRFDVFTRIPHFPFPGGTALRTPLLVLAMTWYRLRDLL